MEIKRFCSFVFEAPLNYFDTDDFGQILKSIYGRSLQHGALWYTKYGWYGILASLRRSGKNEQRIFMYYNNKLISEKVIFLFSF
jgi:hypothetical protein